MQMNVSAALLCIIEPSLGAYLDLSAIKFIAH